MAGCRSRNRAVCIVAVLVVTTFWIHNFLNLYTSKFTRQPQANADNRLEMSSVRFQNEELQQSPVSPSPSKPEPCGMDSCFDYSHCALNSGFPVYFYSDKDLAPLSDTFQLSSVKYDSQRMYGTQDPHRACVFVVGVGEAVANRNPPSDLENIRALPYWNYEGSNHLVVTFTMNDTQGFVPRRTGQAMMASPAFLEGFRDNFDIIIPPKPEPVKGELWTQLPPLFPVQRKHLLSFWGEYIQTPGGETDQLQELKTTVMSDLHILQKTEGVDLVTSCGESKSSGCLTDWALCGTAAERSSQLSQSTFALLMPPLDRSLASTILFQTRLQEALRNGAVPVIVGPSQNRLPFREMINWRDVSICLPFPRLRDLIHILSSFSDNDIFEFRRLGRFIFETYFSSSEHVLLAALTVLRSRLRIPAVPVLEDPTSVIFRYPDGSANEAVKTDGHTPKSTLRIPSPRFQRNFPSSLEQRMWNQPGYGYPFFRFPSTPFEPVLPAESKVSGQAFDDNLGGSSPQEQFTVLLNSYKRPISLLAAIRRLKGLPYLNKVLVIWVDPDPPSPALVWPLIHVPVVVVRVNGTSLNTRYQPFDAIETDCVLSLDDDLNIGHKYIVHAFKVWRSERDNIVAFKVPRRAVVWNNEKNLWEFCEKCPYTEYPVALPTMGFIHKMYLYMYTHAMPQAIRDLVTEGRNCEDFAMAFLVAHVSRKPPILASSDVRNYCPGCVSSNAISHSNSEHWDKRNNCLNVFSKIYGYMPLLFRPRPI